MLGKIRFSIARNLRTFNRFMCIVNTQESVYRSNLAASNKITLVILISKGFDTSGWELTELLEG